MQRNGKYDPYMVGGGGGVSQQNLPMRKPKHWTYQAKISNQLFYMWKKKFKKKHV